MSTGISASKAKIGVKYPLITTCVMNTHSISPNVDTADYKLQSSETIIAIKTEQQGYTTSFNIMANQNKGESTGWKQSLWGNNVFATSDLSGRTPDNLDQVNKPNVNSFNPPYQDTVRG